MKLVKVDHVVLTLKISPAGQGMSKQEVDNLVNKRLAEGYDDVQIFNVKTNLDERLAPTDLVQLYIFLQHEDEEVVRVGRPRKVAEPVNA